MIIGMDDYKFILGIEFTVEQEVVSISHLGKSFNHARVVEPMIYPTTGSMEGECEITTICVDARQ